MKPLPHFFIPSSQYISIPFTDDLETIRTAVDKSAMGAICLTDTGGRLIGICSDADLRKSRENPINYSPTTITYDSTRTGLTRDYIPVIDDDSKLIGVLFQPGPQIFGLISDIDSICIIGVGYVGLTLAIAFALQGISVTAIDHNLELITSLKSGKLPITETGLADAFSKSDQYLHFEHTSVFKDKSLPSRLCVVTVGTPLTGEKTVNLNYIYSVIDFIEQSKSSDDTIVVLRSTVPVGTSDKLQNHLLANGSKTKVVMSPERTVEGKAIEELFTNPQIIGSSWLWESLSVYKLFSKLSNKITLFPSPTHAELAKLADNTYRDLHFAYSNFFCRVSASLGLQGSSIISAVNDDYQRNSIASPSIGVGGPCLSKDAYLFHNGLESSGLNSFDNSFILRGRMEDDLQLSWLSNKIVEHCASIPAPLIAIVGVAFKGIPLTGDVRDSSSLKLTSIFPSNFKISYYDPVVDTTDPYCTVPIKTDFELALASADVVVVMHNASWISRCNWKKALSSVSPRCLFIDGSGALAEVVYGVESNIKYFSL